MSLAWNALTSCQKPKEGELCEITFEEDKQHWYGEARYTNGEFICVHDNEPFEPESVYRFRWRVLRENADSGEREVQGPNGMRMLETWIRR